MASPRTAIPPDEYFRTPVESWPTRYPAPGSYLRVVANPFLAVATLLLGGQALGQLARRGLLRNIEIWVVIGIGWFLLRWLPRLFQFHCLDCGATGPLRDWKAHTCFPSSLNRFLGPRTRLPWPSPGIQLSLWFLGSLYLLPWILRAA